MTHPQEPRTAHRYDHDEMWRHHHDSETGDPIWWEGVAQFGGFPGEHRHDEAEAAPSPDDGALRAAVEALDWLDENAPLWWEQAPRGTPMTPMQVPIRERVRTISAALVASSPAVDVGALRAAQRWYVDGAMVYTEDGGGGAFVADAATPNDAQRFADWHNAARESKRTPQ